MSAWLKFGSGPVLGSLARYAHGVLDPYLVWGDGTGFGDYPSAQSLRVLIELHAGFDARQLALACQGHAAIPAIYVDAEATVCTATVTPGFFALLSAGLKAKVRRVDLVEPIIPDRAPAWAPTPSVMNPGPRVRSSGELLLGVIDYGCPFAHRRFRTQQGAGQGAGKEGSTRVLSAWDQDAGSSWRIGSQAAGVPAEFGYGRELSRAQINGLIKRYVDEDACYQGSGNDVMRRPVSHGAHVMDILAGPSPVESRMLAQEGGPIDDEPDHSAAALADIVFVQLPRRCLQDTSGGWLGGQLLDGVRYILACARDKSRVVINISYGSYVGPHDGSSIFEQALDALVAQARAREIELTVVLAAGNSRLARCHAYQQLPPSEVRCLTWHVLPDAGAPSFLQLWLSRASDVTVQVNSPDGASKRLTLGQAATWSSGLKSYGMVVFSTRHGVEQGGGMVLVAIRRTASFDPDYPVAPAGIWTIDVINRALEGPPVTVTTYVSRNDADVGMLRRGRQSFLSDPAYDRQRYLEEAVMDSDDAAVQRRGTLNGIATGKSVVVVGGWRYRDDKQGRTASEGPTRTGQIKPRTGGLDWNGVSEESAALHGVLAAANRSGTTVRLKGTSFAAPQAARKLAK